MVPMTTRRKQLSARTYSADRGSWMGNPLPPGDLSNRRGLFLKQECTPPTTVQSLRPNTRALSPISTKGGQCIAGEDHLR